MDPLRLLFAVFVFLCLSPLPNSQKDSAMTQHATGPFEVKVAPLEPAFKFTENPIVRFSLDKQFHGDLEATSQGEILSAGSPKTSGGYVAIERVSGTLSGRTGTFVLQHNATMTNGAPQMNIIVVPGTGTGQLTGLAGAMAIIIKEGKHSYDFAYTLPDPK
jgi:Protein of unknown function (DUF3224)